MKKALENTAGKGENASYHHFLPFPMAFSIQSKREIVILGIFNLMSANVFDLVTSKILSFGKRLKKHCTLLAKLYDLAN